MVEWIRRSIQKLWIFKDLIYTPYGLLELATYRHKMAVNMENSPFTLYTEFHIFFFLYKTLLLCSSITWTYWFFINFGMNFVDSLSTFVKKEQNVKFCVQSERRVLHVGSHFVLVGCQLKEPMRGVNQIFENCKQLSRPLILQTCTFNQSHSLVQAIKLFLSRPLIYIVWCNHLQTCTFYSVPYTHTCLKLLHIIIKNSHSLLYITCEAVYTS